MIAAYGAITQALLGTLLTWGLTAAGAACIIFLRGNQRKSLDVSLGFAAGVMLAASFWSLLNPAIEMAENSNIYGDYAIFPASIGFLLGAIFVYGCDKFISYLSISPTHLMLQIAQQSNKHKANDVPLEGAIQYSSQQLQHHHQHHHEQQQHQQQEQQQPQLQEDEEHEQFGQQHQSQQESQQQHQEEQYQQQQCQQEQYPQQQHFPNDEQNDVREIKNSGMNSFPDCLNAQHNNYESTRRRKKVKVNDGKSEQEHTYIAVNEERARLENAAAAQWKRIMLLVIAITVHNIPEGLAVGVGFGAIGSTNSSTFEAARNLAIGIGIQNFPEGLAVSLPLRAAGFSVLRAFWYGQLSGMVEPIFGVVGAVAVTLSNAILPYALAFAAGAMIYIVADDILPEAHASGNGTMATWGTVLGFLIMMCLDVTLS